MTEAEPLSLERPGCEIAYRSQGAGPPLLLLHATLSSSRELGVLARRLAGEFRVTSMDRRASGESSLPPGTAPAAIDVAVHVADLAALIERVAGEPVAVVGHSYGGCLALELAARHPELVNAVWVYEPPYAQVGPPAVRERLVEIGERTRQANEQSGPGDAAEAFLAGVSGAGIVERLSPGARERIRGQGAAAVAEASLLGLDPDGLGRIECPVAVVTGRESAEAYLVIADALVERVPGALRELLDGGDHMAPLTRPGAVATSILDFAARQP